MLIFRFFENAQIVLINPLWLPQSWGRRKEFGDTPKPRQRGFAPLNSLFQFLVLPSLGGFIGLGDTPKPPAGEISCTSLVKDPSALPTYFKQSLKLKAVHPLSTLPPPAYPWRRLPPGAPAAPRIYYLPLLPSGPDGVHSVLPRRTQCSQPMDRRQSRKEQSLERGFDPAIADCGYRAPLSPHLARPRENSTLRGWNCQA